MTPTASATEPLTADVAVIGGGPAGVAAALRAAELGASVVLLEAHRLGGTCVNSGCVPTRVLAKTARLMRDVRIAHEYGIAATGTIDWPATVARVRSTVDRVRAAKADADRLDAAGVTVVLDGRASFVDASTLVTEGGTTVSAQTVIVAVGGHSRPLPIPGAELATAPEHVLDLPELPHRVAIIGAGNTGAQLTTILRSFGAEVTLLDVAERILMPSDPDISAAVTAAFREQGVRVVTGIGGVTAITAVDDGLQLEAGEAGGVFDAIIMATGWPADVADLGLERAGVPHTGRSVPADHTFRTAVPTIFSVGDANGRDMLVQAAVFEAEAAAENAVLDANRHTPHLGQRLPDPTSGDDAWHPTGWGLLPAGGFTDPDYAGVGFTQEQAREHDPGCRIVSVPFSRLERAVIDDREVGFLKLIADRSGERILGAHCVGEHAVEIVQTVTTAMVAGIGPGDLAAVRFAYPTYTAIVGMAARELLRLT